jgi:hypothetical protein
MESFFSEKDLAEARAGYRERQRRYQRDELNVLRLLDSEPAGSTSLCSSLCSEYIYTERIEKRFAQLGKLEEQTILYLVHEMLNGYGHLIRSEGKAAFSINENMIGINTEEVLKVWFH